MDYKTLLKLETISIYKGEHFVSEDSSSIQIRSD